MAAIIACVEHHLGARYGLEVIVREPHELKTEPEYADVRVDKWQVSGAVGAEGIESEFRM